jgi:beta-lactam-binding protein with PASTA domain
MENPFVINTSSNSIPMQGGRGETTITVTNSSGSVLKGRADVMPSKPEATSWMSIAGNAERVFAAGAVEKFVVQLRIPLGVPQGEHTFQIRVSDVADPNERYTIGPAVGFKIAAVSPPPPRSFPVWIFAVIAVVLIAAAGAIAYWMLHRPAASVAEIEVPDVTSKTIPEAKTILEGLGLALGEISRKVEAKPKDIVLQQTPAAHKTAAKGSAIAVVASNESMVLVPALMGKTENQARDALAGLLDIERVERNCSAGSGAPSTIYESIPRTGDSVSRATRVLLRVKDDCVAVPRLVGADKAAAFTQLNSLGLLGEPVAGSPIRPVDAGRADTVEDQSPGPNELVARGSTVTLKFYHLLPRFDTRIFEAEILRQKLTTKTLTLRKP